MRSYPVKKNHIGLVISEIQLYKQTNRHPVTLLYELGFLQRIGFLCHLKKGEVIFTLEDHWY